MIAAPATRRLPRPPRPAPPRGWSCESRRELAEPDLWRLDRDGMPALTVEAYGLHVRPIVIAAAGRFWLEASELELVAHALGELMRHLAAVAAWEVRR